MTSVRKSAQEIVSEIMTVASLPSIYFRLLEVTNSQHSSANDFARVLSEDSGLTARLLRIVNSAYFGFAGKIDTVSRAVTVIGTGQLCELALATSVIKIFNNIPQNLINMDQFWRHSLACGLFARTLAMYREESNAERFFVAGLLHDIGRLIMFIKLPDDSRQILQQYQRVGDMLYSVEKEVLSYNHAALGGLLLEKWNLPRPHQEAVAYHHAPKLATLFPIETAVVHVADIMANALQYGTSGERFVPPLDPVIWDVVGVDPSQIPYVMDEVENVFHDMIKAILSPT